MVLELDEICGAFTEEEDQSVGNYPGDHKPEYFQYKDEGCEHARSCLDCPFPRCLYDRPFRNRRLRREERDKEISRLFHAGRKVKTLARLFKVGPRTVYRAIKESKNAEGMDHE